MIDDNQNDFIEEGEENDLSERMNALNEEYLLYLSIRSVKFDALRKN